MENSQVQKEIYALELRKATLNSQIKEFETAQHSIEMKQTATTLAWLGSFVVASAPGIDLFGDGACLPMTALNAEYTEEKRGLQAEIDQRREETRLAKDRLGELRNELMALRPSHPPLLQVADLPQSRRARRAAARRVHKGKNPTPPKGLAAA